MVAFSGAACLGAPSDWWFPDLGGTTRTAKQICRKCAALEECASWVLQHPDAMPGVWGGMSVGEREKIRGRTGRLR